MEPLDFENICRLCLDDSAFKEMSDKHNNSEVDYYFMLNYCASVEAKSNDSLPSKMCKKCEHLLVKHYKFRNSIIETDTRLKEILESKKNIFLQDLILITEENLEVKKEENEDNSNDNFEDTIAHESTEEDPPIPLDLVKIECETERPKKRTKKRKPYKKKHKNEDATYQCETCSKIFTKKSNFYQHQQTHNDERPFQCQLCGKRYKTNGTLTKHKATHTDEKSHECHICHKKFLLPYQLKLHMRTHTGDRPHVCSSCGKSFLQYNNLIQHNRIHTGEKPYSCDICDKKFSQEATRRRHRLSHTGEKPYTCNECGKLFASGSSFRSHKRVHIADFPNMCKICTKIFKNEDELKRHVISSHTKEKNFECNICHNTFATNRYLEIHLQTHTNHTVNCNLCGKTLRYRSLAIHKKKVCVNRNK